ncbi:MAG: type I DNA topoisomerase [Gemmatales bacterium]
MATRKTADKTTKPAAPKKTTTKAATAKVASTKATKVTKKAANPAVETPSEPTPAVKRTRGTGKNLVIVESPAKAKTIGKYLGPDFEVTASKGHVRDLPMKKFGIDIENGWSATYQDLPDRLDLINGLKKMAAKSKMVYLAPDPDREGEAIAWHLKESLGLDDDQVQRVTFNEITKSAVQTAFANPRAINQDLVRAQETRRFLDRVVGYQLSPLLRKKITRHATAGRVQSVAVRLIVEKEREIQAFKSEEYWKITGTFMPVDAASKLASDFFKKLREAEAKRKEEAANKNVGKHDDEEIADPETSETSEPEASATEPKLELVEELPEGAFTAELNQWDGKKFEASDGATSQAIVDAINQHPVSVSKIEQKDRQERPSPPFTTSTLQQQAAMRLRYTAKRTMMAAQRLYEGVEIKGEGSVALITYMRTDSVRVGNDALKAVREHIESHYGKPYLPASANTYASGKSAQEGHEAVRPTDLSQTPDKLRNIIAPEQFKLYELIYRRFVASQMTPAVFAVTNVEIEAAQKKGIFKAQGKILKFDGYRKVLAPGKSEDAILPALKENDPLSLMELVPTQHFTQPPARFNEASLVKTLEKEGIGRPSTYAAIISKIQERGYVELKERRFYASELGMVITDALVANFPQIIDVKFTSHMEDELDGIENAKIKWRDVLDEFYQPFNKLLKTAEASMEPVKGIETGEKCPTCGSPLIIKWSKLGKFAGCSNYPECKYIKPGEGESGPRVVETEYKCTDCGKPLLERMGKYGKFYACSGYPECKMVMNIGEGGTPVPAMTKTDHVCEKCGKPMVLREGKRGPFLACTGYPKCKNAKDVDKNGNPMKPIDTGIMCDKCGGPMAVRKGPRGPFLGCAAYPKCRNAKPLPEDLKEKLKDILPPPPPKKELPDVEITEPCPECGGPMKLRAFRGRYFLGCTKYPKCKGTGKVSEELAAKLGPP